jgi:zinc/manganese transport system substrate-binding protein
MHSPSRRWLTLLTFAILALSGCTQAKDPWAGAGKQQKRVLVSFPPLYSMTQAIAGDDAYVLSLLSQQGPHDANESPGDMVKVNRAELIVTNGLGLDDRLIDKLVEGARNKTTPLKVGDEILRQDKKEVLPADKDHEHGAGDHHHHHGQFDPHIWLGPPQAIKMVHTIADQLGKLDAAHNEEYQKRAAAFATEIEKVQAYGTELLKGKKNRNLITQHESLGYFAKAFALDIKGSLQVQPGVDVTSGDLDRLRELCKKQDVRVIAVEPQYNAQLARTLQKELSLDGHPVQVIEVDPLETAPLAANSPNPDPGYYLRKMRENIETLAKALP